MYSSSLRFFYPVVSPSGLAEADLGAVVHADIVVLMLPGDDGGGHQEDQGDQKALGQQADADGDDDEGGGGGGENVVRDQGHDDHQQEHGDGEFPVERNGHAEVAGEALAALKLHPEGVDMSQDGGNTRCGADQGRIREQQPSQNDRQGGFADVVDGNQRTCAPAHEDDGVAGAGVAGAVGGQIHLFHGGDVLCHIGAAQKIAQGDDKDVFHRGSSFFLYHNTKSRSL